jgi:AcrR family transcriptional regulator
MIPPSAASGGEENRPERGKKRRRAQRGSGEQLRAEIIAAAKQLLAESGSADAMSIRSVAEAVGVTTPSIYLHFADKTALLSAIVVDVFTELDTRMVAAGAAADSPLARLRAFGLAYVRFAIEHPEHYRIATMDPYPKPDAAVDDVLASSAFTHFNATVVECIAAGIFVGDDPLPITFDLWAAAHGIAALMIAKPYLPWGDREAVADRVLCSAAIGHAAMGLFEGEITPDEMTAWIAEQHQARSR